MRRGWLRFEFSTFAVSLLGGLLPVVVLSVVSFISLSSLSQPLREIVLHHNQSLLRNRAELCDREVAARLRAIGDHVAACLYRARSPSLETTDESAAPTDWDLIQGIRWHLPGLVPDSPAITAVKEDSAESILAALSAEREPGRRRELMQALCALSPLVQDPLGFSYAVEAGLKLGQKDQTFRRQLLVGGARLERATVEASIAGLGGALEIDELPVPLRMQPWPPGVTAAHSALEAGKLLYGAEAPGGGVLVLEIDGRRLLQRAFASIERAEPTGAAVSVRDAGQEGEPLAVALAPPFAGFYELVLAPSAAESAFPLGLLARMRGVHYLWWVMAVLLVGVVGSIFLGVIASRRVQTSQKKDDFLRLVSHQLRTPIASLKVLAETLSLGRVRGEMERHELTAQLQKETERLAELVERVLEYGRSEGGRANAREVVSDPGDLVEEAVRTFVERNPDSGEIVMRTAQEFHPVVLDRGAVIQVILNLLSNARKFSGPEPPIEVTVGEESRNLFVEVKDQGPGIRKRDQRKVFRAFYRANPSSGPPGFGLGLAYCAKVAEAHRGRMRVESAPGKGSAFTLEIPLVYPDKGA